MKYAIGGPDERANAIVVAKGQVQDAGPLFGGLDAKIEASNLVCRVAEALGIDDPDAEFTIKSCPRLI